MYSILVEAAAVMLKVLRYLPPGALKSWVMANAVFAISFVVGVGMLKSPLVLCLGCAAALMLAWPLARRIALLAWAVAVHGRWPAHKNV